MTKNETTPITSLDALIKKAKGLEDRPATVVIDAGSIKLEINNLTDDEVLEYTEELTRMASDGSDSIVDELNKLKEVLYTHCPILREYAASVRNENRAEPWDVFDEIFDAADKITLRNDFYAKSGINTVFERVAGKNG